MAVAVYEDLQCSDCAAFRKMLDETLLPRYGARIAIEHHDFPLPNHTWARRAAVAARFFEQAKPEFGVDYRREVMVRMSALSTANFDEHLARFAASRNVDAANAVAALQDDRLAALVEKDYRSGVARGVVRTPTVFVDGKPFIETFTVEAISAAIDQALTPKRDK